MAELNDRQLRFIDKYLINLNATKAAILAGYSEKTAYSIGQRLLKKVEVKTAIEERQAAMQERTEITQDRVLKEIARLAFFDPRKFYDDDGLLIPIHKLDDDAAAVISGMDVVQLKKLEGDTEAIDNYLKKIKLSNKEKALEMLGRHFGMFTDKVEHTLPPELMSALQAVMPEDMYTQFIDVFLGLIKSK